MRNLEKNKNRATLHICSIRNELRAAVANLKLMTGSRTEIGPLKDK